MPNRPTTTLTILPPLPRRWQNKLARKIRHAVQVTLRGEGLEEPVQVSLVLCDDATIHALNRQFLGHDYPTDVLSFPLNAPTPDGKHLLGEIVISVETAERNARRYRQPLERELLHLVIHGILHLLGYDDTTPKNRRRMRRKELAYLRKVTGKT
jgi:probable rRNA maturation factor